MFIIQNVCNTNVLQKYSTQTVAHGVKRFISQFKVMCIKTVNIMLCANNIIKLYHNTVHKAVSRLIIGLQ